MATQLSPAYRRLTADQFFELDLGEGRWELIDGLIYAMAGGTQKHAALAANILVALDGRLRGRDCRALGGDFATKVNDSNVRLPDVSVYRDWSKRRDQDRKRFGAPKVVFEILSPSTRKIDEFEKLPQYQQVDEIEAIVLVDPDDDSVRLFERARSGWAERRLAANEDLRLRCIELTLPQDEIFDLA